MDQDQKEREYNIGLWIVRIILALAIFGACILISLLPFGILLLLILGVVLAITYDKKDTKD